VAKSLMPSHYASREFQVQAEELVRLSAGLTDEQKMLAEYWSETPESPLAPARWSKFAQWISGRDHHSLDDDVKMFFVLNNALLDASIAASDLKREFNSIRPITAITLLSNEKRIRSWGGPGKGTVEMEGSHWIPYQPATSPMPPSPDYVSETSTYAAAAAWILNSWTGTDHFGYSVAIPAGNSIIEPGVTPAHAIVLQWGTFGDAANAAGMSGRYAGINFPNYDLAGRRLGRLVGEKVWAKAQEYFSGASKPLTFSELHSSAAPTHMR
jgi:hypothetical protein